MPLPSPPADLGSLIRTRQYRVLLVFAAVIHRIALGTADRGHRHPADPGDGSQCVSLHLISHHPEPAPGGTDSGV